MEKSKGTRAWIAECHRLLDRCVGQVKKGDLAEVRESIEVIFDLLRHIDECHDKTGLRYLPEVARRLHHSRDLGEPFDFLT
jgi:hypothetical protein